MNFLNASLLIRDDVVTVQVRHVRQRSDTLYTYICEKDIAATLKKGSQVVVRNSRGFFVGIVEQVDDVLDIDVDAGFTYCWVIQKVDVDKAGRIYMQSQEIARELERRKTESYRQQILNMLGVTQLEAKQLLHKATKE